MTELFDSAWLVEGLGYAAVALVALSFQIDNRKAILKYLIVGMILLSLHQVLLGALAGAAANSLTILRNLLFYNKEAHFLLRAWWWPYLFSLILGASSLWFWQDWYSVLPALAVVCSTFALWMDDTKLIRLLSVLGPLVWIPYALLIDSIPTVLLQVIIITSILIAIYRFDTPTKP